MNLCCVIGVQVAMIFGQPETKTMGPLQGSWRVKSGKVNGKELKLPERTVWRFTFGKDSKLLMRKVGHPDVVGRFTLGGDQQTKEIDLIVDQGDRRETTPGICKRDGDILTIALPTDQAQKRPAGFAARENVAVFILSRQKPGPDDDIAEVKAGPPADAAKLAGRWELIADSKDESVVVDFRLRENKLDFRRQAETTVIGTIKMTSKTSGTLTLVLNPQGKKDGFAIVESFDEKTKEATLRLIHFQLRGETLEMFGEARPPIGTTFNLTGRWRRPTAKK